MENKKQLDEIWYKDPKTVKTFLESKPEYEQLCAEIAYILKKKLKAQHIEFSAVSFRPKELKSFLEKLQLKKYKRPFKEITDFAGVRVVFLYRDDFEKIEKIINDEFEIVEKVDKLNEKGTEKFGYVAVHYIVKLGKHSTGARYDDLKNLSCEIQVRTVLQDAWAIIEHHLVYKKEEDIPKKLQRKLNGLAGLFETADYNFETIRKERNLYINEIQESMGTNEFLNNEVNLDTFREYIKWKFPEEVTEGFNKQLSNIYEDISTLELNSLKDIDYIVEKHKPKIEEIKKELKSALWSGALIVGCLLCIEMDDLRMVAKLPNESKDFLNKLKSK